MQTRIVGLCKKPFCRSNDSNVIATFFTIDSYWLLDPFLTIKQILKLKALRM